MKVIVGILLGMALCGRGNVAQRPETLEQDGTWWDGLTPQRQRELADTLYVWRGIERSGGAGGMAQLEQERMGPLRIGEPLALGRVERAAWVLEKKRQYILNKKYFCC
jgi:hypothetical protein